MKTIPRPTNNYFLVKCCWLACLLIGFASPVFTQSETASEKAESKTDTAKVENKKSAEKKNLRLNFDVFKINQEVKLQASAKLKVEGKFKNIAGVVVSFYKGEVAPGNFLGTDTTNRHGEAYWMVPAAPISDTIESISYSAAVQDNPYYEDVEETAAVSPSVLDMKLEEEDSAMTVKIFLGHPDEAGQVIPIPGATCQVYVKRLFGLLPIGDPETTDEEGKISIEFPRDIKGDENGNITVVAQVTENEFVGNVEANQTMQWGIPTEKNDFYTQRQLWSARSNSPIPLVIIVNLVLLGVWGTIVFIFLEIFRINKLGKTN